MGLDVCSLNSGPSTRIMQDRGSITSPGRKRYSKPSSVRGVSISTLSLASLESHKRRRKPRNRQDPRDGDGTREIVSFHKRRIGLPKTFDPDDLDDAKTEHTSNLTEHSLSIRQSLLVNEFGSPEVDDEESTNPHDEDDGTDDDDEDDGTDDDDEEDLVSLGERSGLCRSSQTVETRESRFPILLDQWKTRENEQKQRALSRAPDTRSKASYLSEDEDQSCFEGVLKHWRKRDVQRNNSSEDSSLSNQPEVVVGDENSEISSLGDSLREGLRSWGCESDSCFDFGYDARFDSTIQQSPRSAKKKKKKAVKKVKDPKSPKKKDGLKPPKKKKKSKKKLKKSSEDTSYATFDAAMDAAETAMDASMAEESVATQQDTTSQCKKNKKNKNKKSKSKRKIKSSKPPPRKI